MQAGGSESRKAYALLAAERYSTDHPLLFALLDGKAIRSALLKTVDLTGLEMLGTRISQAQARFNG